MNLANKAIQVICKISEDQGNSVLYPIFIIGPDLYFNVLALSLKTALGGGVTRTKITFCFEPKTVFCLLSGIFFFFFSNQEVAFLEKEMLDLTGTAVSVEQFFFSSA